jgi:putative hydrolase of the HAD superfamily
MPEQRPITAVLWDFGGVILTSPFDAFANFERERGLPHGLIRTINSTNPDTNAWAKLERSEVDVDTFIGLFEGEARDLGHELDARDLLGLLNGKVRPQMVEALRRCKDAGYKLGCLTNNVHDSNRRMDSERENAVAEAMSFFDHVTESRHMGVRKPEVRFYEMACEALSIHPTEAVFLDDLGINLKPAAALGMRTIKVVDPDDALDQLSEILGFALR